MYIVTAELQTANVAYFQRKIQLSGFCAFPDGLPAQLSGVLLYCKWAVMNVIFDITFVPVHSAVYAGW
jgi:hypothetical protein